MKLAAAQNGDALVEYDSIRRTYQVTRSIAWGLWGITSLTLYLIGHWDLGWTIAALAFLAAMHAFWIRDKARYSMERTHMIDTIGVASFCLAGIPATSLGGAIFYMVVVPFLLLPPRRARPMIIRVASIFAPTVALSLVFDLTRPTGLPAGLINIVIDLLALGMIVSLCSTAFSNIRRLRARETAALRAEEQALEAKNNFVSMVSHELRTPLTGISGFAETLRESWHDLPRWEVDDFIQIICEESRHLDRLVEDILIIPRLETGRVKINPTLVEMLPLIEQVAALVFSGETASRVRIDMPPGPMAWVDPDRIRQIVTNLLVNARKYGGPQVTVEGRPLGDKYLVAVVDNGPGIPESDRERIFDPFEQLDRGPASEQKGVGLGLPIARGLARAMGGDLWVEAAEPSGARFCFTMITSPAQGSNAPQPMVAATPLGSNPKPAAAASSSQTLHLIGSPGSTGKGKAHLQAGK